MHLGWSHVQNYEDEDINEDDKNDSYLANKLTGRQAVDDFLSHFTWINFLVCLLQQLHVSHTRNTHNKLPRTTRKT